METATFRIPEQNYEKLTEQIAQLNKQAKKLRCQPIRLTELDFEEVRYFDSSLGYECVQVYVHCEVSGETPIINGWQFVATAELDDEGLAIVRAVPGLVVEGELEQFRRAVNWCDHCQQKRLRNNVYVLRHEDGQTYKQVGKNCLVDFLGHENPLALAKMAEMLLDAIDLCSAAEHDESGSGNKNWLVLEEYLTWVAGCIRNFGWFSRKKAELEDGWVTSDRALNSMMGKHKEYVPVEKDRELAKQAIEWIREQEAFVESGNDYQSNLYIACRKDVINFKKTGICASLIVAYQRAMEIEFEKKNRKESKEQGKAGEKLVRTVTCTKVVSYESQFKRGSAYIIMMIDQDGNRYKWFASNWMMEENKQYVVRGTVKGYDEYKGIVSTVLTRCKVEEIITQLAG